RVASLQEEKECKIEAVSLNVLGFWSCSKCTVNASVFQGNFFDEFQLEGVSADTNEIFLEVAPENLSRHHMTPLKTAQNAKSVKIKLTKKSCPCLTLAAELSIQSSRRTLPHVKVKLS
uniref:Uncharacterized protein n=1 Tax=Sinocyclocheilus anshuiensis TaxID=1608454 RepID=A0A671QBD5_9TELE